MADPTVIARVQLRDKLQGLRSRVGDEATKREASLLEAHRRVDERIARKVGVASGSGRRRKLYLIVALVLLLVGFYVFAYTLPERYPAVEQFIVRLSGKYTYPAQRFFRFVSLPFMWRFPRLSTFMYNPTCAVNNPLYVPEGQGDGGEESTSVARKKPGKGGKKSQGGDDMDEGLEDSDAPEESCSCVGIRSAGRVKNRAALKMKHILKDPGVPLVLTIDNSTDLAATRRIEKAFLQVLGEHRKDFGENLCHAKSSATGEQSCSDTVNGALAALLGDGSEPPPDDFAATWSYCRASAQTAMAHLMRAAKPSSYLLAKNAIYTESPSLMVSRASNSSTKDMPESLMVDLDYAVYHQIVGRRRFLLQPAFCTRCKFIKLTLSAGEVLFFHSAVWQESPMGAVVREGDQDEWSITLGFSLGTEKSRSGSIYNTPDWQDDSKSC